MAQVDSPVLTHFAWWLLNLLEFLQLDLACAHVLSGHWKEEAVSGTTGPGTFKATQKSKRRRAPAVAEAAEVFKHIRSFVIAVRPCDHVS